ncbi:ankyrin repeat domain-containing protein, partial [Candidatus Mcinerneyibacteriota bacterium]|nr:ankyrin repeat domain-containing protein [Candidatus Mcinerneyibacteriota bacterium]
LVNAGGDLLARDLDGSTPLHRAACFNKNASVIRALIQAGSDVNGQDKWGNTPYDIAVKEGNEAAMEVLKEAGAERTRSK